MCEPSTPPAWVGRLVLGLWVAAQSCGCAVTLDKPRAPSENSTWSRESGWEEPAEETTSPPTGTKEEASAALSLRTEASKAFEARAYRDALAGLVEIDSRFGDTAVAKEARTSFLIAECYFHLNDYDKAHDYYQKTLKRRPDDAILNQTLNRIYSIGLAFLHGKAKRTFAGIPYRSPTFGVDILLGEKGLVTRYPYLSYSDSALWEIAEYYFNKKQYPEAEKIYERLVRDYSDGNWGEEAEYKLALSVYKQIRGVDYDQAPLKTAKRRFDLYRSHHPRGVRINEVQKYRQEIKEMEARYDLKVAKYYLRESRPEAAMYYLRSVLLNNPLTEAGNEAREIYHQMSRFRSHEQQGTGK